MRGLSLLVIMVTAVAASVQLTAVRSPSVRAAGRPMRAAAAGHALIQPRRKLPPLPHCVLYAAAIALA